MKIKPSLNTRDYKELSAKTGNILSGNLKIRLEKLMADIDKALGGA